MSFFPFVISRHEKELYCAFLFLSRRRINRQRGWISLRMSVCGESTTGREFAFSERVARCIIRKNRSMNVSPRPDGQIEQEQIERLREIGDWLKRYGQSIYSTRGGPYLPGDFGVSTYHDRTIHLHILKGAHKTLSLPALPAKILGCSSLTGGSVACKETADSVEITLNGNGEALDTIIALTLASPASEIKPIATPVTRKE
jgi:hypothetical protein